MGSRQAAYQSHHMIGSRVSYDMPPPVPLAYAHRMRPRKVYQGRRRPCGGKSVPSPARSGSSALRAGARKILKRLRVLPAISNPMRGREAQTVPSYRNFFLHTTRFEPAQTRNVVLSDLPPGVILTRMSEPESGRKMAVRRNALPGLWLRSFGGVVRIFDPFDP